MPATVVPRDALAPVVPFVSRTSALWLSQGDPVFGRVEPSESAEGDGGVPNREAG